jgi:hypothetical protein
MDDAPMTTRSRTFDLGAGIITMAVALLNVTGSVQGFASGCSLTIAPIGVRIAGGGFIRRSRVAGFPPLRSGGS